MLKNDHIIILPLSPGKHVGVVGKHVIIRDGDNLSWIGKVQNEGTATLVIGRHGITGGLNIDSASYQLVPLRNGLQAIVRLDRSKVKPVDNLNASVAINSQRMDSIKVVAKRAKEEALKNGELKTVRPNELNPGPDIDVLVAYTAQAENSVSNIDQVIQNSIDQTNQAFNNSDIYANLRLVYSMMVNYDALGHSYDDILNAMQNPSDGVMDNIKPARNQYLADIVVLLVGAEGPLDNVGAADIFFDDKPAPAIKTTAFVVVDAPYSNNPMYYAFAHEVAHLFGACHNIGQDPHTQPFAYGHGYIQQPDGLWHTIMAYESDCNNCPVIQYYSNPNVTYGGDPTGETGVANNAHVINLTRYTLRDFRALDPPTNFTLTNPHHDGEHPHFTWVPNSEANGSTVYRCKGGSPNPGVGCFQSILGWTQDGPNELTDLNVTIANLPGTCTKYATYYVKDYNSTGYSDRSYPLIVICTDRS